MERQLEDGRKRDAAAKIEANELRTSITQRDRELASQAALCRDLSSALEKRKHVINDLSSQVNDEQKKRTESSHMVETRSRRVIELEADLDASVKRERALINELSEEKKQRTELVSNTFAFHFAFLLFPLTHGSLLVT
jgi:predicted RNase H-like nuclease (RuvC/YqgF family)